MPEIFDSSIFDISIFGGPGAEIMPSTGTGRLHIHEAPGDPCVACGDAYESTLIFTRSVSQWNREHRNCAPGTIISRTYTITGRADPRTSALKDERLPNRKRTRDLR